MNNTWDYAAEMAEKHANSGGIFVRLADDGDKVVGAFCGEPFAHEVVWTGERYEEYDSLIHTDKPSLRVSLNFFIPADDSMKIIEGGTNWFKDVLKVRDKYGLDKWLFEIERHGAAGDPKTKYTILPEEKIDAEIHSRIDAAGLHDLHVGPSGDRKSNTRPISSDGAAKLTARLKALPRTAVDTFLQHFKVARVRDLTESNMDEACQLLEGLEARVKQQAAPQKPEIDPFA